VRPPDGMFEHGAYAPLERSPSGVRLAHVEMGNNVSSSAWVCMGLTVNCCDRWMPRGGSGHVRFEL
jgi:hypothetical protein